MTQSLFSRCLIGSVIAAPIVAGLVFGMAKLIEVREIVLSKDPTRMLVQLTPKIEPTDVRLTSRVQPIKAAVKPPPPPKFSVAGGKIDLPTPRLEGNVPIDAGAARMMPMTLDVAIVPDTDARPIRPPAPQMPRGAMDRGISGSCDVRFNVDMRGKPYGIVATCTHAVFEDEAKRSVAAVEFAPKIVRGKPVERKNVIYPLEFKVE